MERPEGYPETPALDKMAACREPQPFAYTAFMEWLDSQGIRGVIADGNGDGWHQESAVPRPLLDSLASECFGGKHMPVGSQELGELLDLWSENGISRCVYRGQHCPWPKQEEEQERYFGLRGTRINIVVNPAGYYMDGRSIERLLADFYGIDLRECDRERERVMDYVREWNRKKMEAGV